MCCNAQGVVLKPCCCPLTQKQAEPLCCCDGAALPVPVLLHGLAHGGGLTDVLHQLLVSQIHTLQHRQAKGCTWGEAHLQGQSCKKLTWLKCCVLAHAWTELAAMVSALHGRSIPTSHRPAPFHTVVAYTVTMENVLHCARQTLSSTKLGLVCLCKHLAAASCDPCQARTCVSSMSSHLLATAATAA